MMRGSALAPLDKNKPLVSSNLPPQLQSKKKIVYRTKKTVSTAKRSIKLQPTYDNTKPKLMTTSAAPRSYSKSKLLQDSEDKESHAHNIKRKSPPPSLEDEPDILTAITPHSLPPQEHHQLFPSPSTSILRSHFPAHENYGNKDDDTTTFFESSSIWSYNVYGHVHQRSLNSSPPKEEDAAPAQCPSFSFKPKTWSSHDFNVLTQLGKGKFGIVYAATYKQQLDCTSDNSDSEDDGDDDEGGPVALKILHKQKVLQCSTAPRLLRREVEIQSRLNHDNILRLHGYFHDKSSIYLVLEPSESGDLYKNCMSSSSNNSLSLQVSSSYIKQVTLALRYLSQHSVAHRDIKPENLLLCGRHQEIIKLCDFGWAVHAPPPSHNMRMTLCGTPEYVPPEMLRYEGEEDEERECAGKTKKKRRRKYSSSSMLSSHTPLSKLRKKYDARFVDSWALGVLAYEMVLGKTPFYVSRQDQEEEAKQKGCQQHEVIFDRINTFVDIEPMSYRDLIESRDDMDYEEEGEVFVDFVRGFMKRDPRRRMTMDDALSHPWIC
uniref:Protein kinase domain-containing protein n=1 Tax=Ditylum brightwellii TaxID=49249 RepID=A0A6U3QRC8_9STRA|mmetsp:Transcript_22148/g.32188  ORF Transcript_22148/g.32188 Transcript_22148/m.32188 type:complete len:546 (+) Transcript_22148:742-2379(+)